MSAKSVETVENGTEIFIPLNKLKKSPKKSPKNARKTPHSEAAIEACAASIDAKGILQNLVVEPELDGEGAPTGCYFVTIGDGRQACPAFAGEAEGDQEDRADPLHRRHGQRSARDQPGRERHPGKHASGRPVRSVREARRRTRFWCGEIAARFGVTPHVVRQRFQLATVPETDAGLSRWRPDAGAVG
jgi:ParB family chromosome partitioning protein